MRGKLEPNPWFTLHSDASRDRDGMQNRISVFSNTLDRAELLNQLAKEVPDYCQQFLFESVETVEAVRRKQSKAPEACLQRTLSMNAVDQFLGMIPLPKPEHLKNEFIDDGVDEEEWRVVPPSNGDKFDSLVFCFSIFLFHHVFCCLANACMAND